MPSNPNIPQLRKQYREYKRLLKENRKRELTLDEQDQLHDLAYFTPAYNKYVAWRRFLPKLLTKRYRYSLLYATIGFWLPTLPIVVMGGATRFTVITWCVMYPSVMCVVEGMLRWLDD